MIGSIVLSFALVSGILSLIMYFLNFRGYKNTLNYARISYHAMVMLVIIASALLWRILLSHSYQYHYVFSYSSNELPFGFLFSTFWGGQEGSFMLWLLLTSIIGLILQSYTSKRGDLEPRVMFVFSLSVLFLLIMVSPWFKNPFAYIWANPVFIETKFISPEFLKLPFMKDFIFSDGGSNQQFVKMTEQLRNILTAGGISVNQFIINGKGLNPQLLNFWMQIHPPILFTGFSMSTVPFAFAMSAMMKNDYKNWVKQSFPWLLAGAGILGLGIMMGGYWAYEMLGWGGYWAWDPVENSSFIPWLISLAAIHTMLVERRSRAKDDKGRFIKTNLILSMLVYILVLYATFLTRSGVLGDASVHSFVSPGNLVYFFLLIFIIVFIIFGFGTLFYRWKSLSQSNVPEENLLSRELSLFTASVVLIASAIIVFVGTSAPILGRSVETKFYVQMQLPLAIIIGLLNGLSLSIKWKKSKGKDLIKNLRNFLLISFFLTALIVVLGSVYKIMMILLVFSSIFLIVINLDIAIKVIKGNKKLVGAYVAHIGIGLFLLGAVGSAGYSIKKDVDLEKGKLVDVLGYKMMFTGFRPIENGTKYAFLIDVKDGNKNFSAKPVMYISDYNKGIMREPFIIVGPTKDIYFSPVGYDEGKTHNGGTNLSVEKGKSINFSDVKITFQDFDFPAEVRQNMIAGKEFKIGVKLKAEKGNYKKQFELFLVNKGGKRTFTSFVSEKLNIKVTLVNLNAAGKVDLSFVDLSKKIDNTVKEKTEILSVEVSIKPFINLVWIGVLVMVIGFFIAVFRRMKESRVI